MTAGFSCRGQFADCLVFRNKLERGVALPAFCAALGAFRDALEVLHDWRRAVAICCAADLVRPRLILML